ncbi:DUF1385 domain-containing protein [Spirochaetota bacterium]
MSEKLHVGGQAVIEGVMMKSPSFYAISLRKNNKSIKKQLNAFTSIRPRKRLNMIGCTSISTKSNIFKIPFIRGMINFGEMLYIGVKSLMYSAEEAELEEEKTEVREQRSEDTKEDNKKPKTIPKSVLYSTLFFSFLLAIFIFVVIPTASLEIFIRETEHPIMFSLFRGLIKLVIFFVYLISISFLKDIRRVFQYHGAEHKIINVFEKKKELTIENAIAEKTFHPRCGTSFLFFVIIVSIFMYLFVVAFYNHYEFFGINALFTDMQLRIIQKTVLILTNIMLLPIIASIAYELIRLSFRLQKFKVFGIFLLPGMLFQRLTAREPSRDMLEVSLASLRMVLDAENGKSR